MPLIDAHRHASDPSNAVVAELYLAPLRCGAATNNATIVK
jgi:hypothetical protein